MIEKGMIVGGKISTINGFVMFQRVSLEELYQRYHLTPELILEDLKKCL